MFVMVSRATPVSFEIRKTLTRLRLRHAFNCFPKSVTFPPMLHHKVPKFASIAVRCLTKTTTPLTGFPTPS